MGVQRVARRRRRRKEPDLLEGVLGLGMLGVAWGAWELSGSLRVTGISVGLFFGAIIAILIARKMAYIERLKKSGIADIDKMDGREFEHYLGHLFKAHGYEVRVTKAAGDFGADLIIVKGGKKIVVQAKRYSKNVGIKAVQETHSSMGYYGAVEAWVVSNSDYTDAARELANSLNVRLIGRERLIELILNKGSERASTQEAAVAAEAPKPVQVKTCPKCGGKMVRRKSRMGAFWGCEKFPECRSTEAI